jgi:hypothetical protein
LAACAAATQPLIRTVFFFPATSVAIVHSEQSTYWRTLHQWDRLQPVGRGVLPKFLNYQKSKATG